MTNISHLAVYVGQEYRHDLAGCLHLKVSHRCGPALWSTLKAQLGEDKLPNSLTWLATGFSTSQAIYWTKGLSSSLRVNQRPPSVSCHLCLSLGQLTTRQCSFLEQASESKTEAIVFL